MKVGAHSLHGGLFIHHAGMVKGIPALGELQDFRVCLRHHPPGIYNRNIIRKFLHRSGADADLRVPIKNPQLSFAPVRVGNIVAVHSGDQFIFTMLDALVQCLSKPSIYRQPNDIHPGTKSLLRLSNRSVQFLIQWAIADQHKIICLYRLRRNASDCLS